MQLFLHLEQVEQGWGSVGHRSSAAGWTNVSSYESSILSPTAVSSSSLSISDCSTDKNAWTHQAQPAFKLNPWKDRQARAWAVSKATSVWIQSPPEDGYQTGTQPSRQCSHSIQYAMQRARCATLLQVAARKTSISCPVMKHIIFNNDLCFILRTMHAECPTKSVLSIAP